MATPAPVVTAYPAAAPSHGYPGAANSYAYPAPTSASTPYEPSYHAQHGIHVDMADIRAQWRYNRWHSCTDVLFNDVIAVFCPCLSVAQVASSVGRSFAVALMAFAVSYVGGIVSYTIGRTLHESVFAWHDGVFPLLSAWAMYAFGPCATLAVAAWMALFAEIGSVFQPAHSVFDDSTVSSTSIILMVLHALLQVPQVVMVLQLHTARTTRSNLPQRRLYTVCCPTFAVAEMAAHAKNLNNMSACYLGSLNELPAYEQ